MGIIWEEPPAEAMRQHREGTLGQWLAELKERPLVWARLDREYTNLNTARTTAGTIRTGALRGFKKGEYEAVSHGGRVWARFVGAAVVAPDADEDDGSADDDERRAYPPRVRAWAKLRGIEVKPGRLPDALVKRYEEETGDTRPPSPLSAVPAGPPA